MGRTVPTFVQLIQQAADRWKKFRRALRREDQPHFDRLFVRVRCYTQAATYQCNDDPMAAILLSIALDQEKRLSAVEKSSSERRGDCEIAGWILDLYPNQRGMTLWLIDRNQAHYCLTDEFVPAFYVSGSTDKLARLQDAAQTQPLTSETELTERIDLWLNATRQVLKVSVCVRQTLWAGVIGYIVLTLACSFTTAASWSLRCTAGRRGYFRLPMSK